MLTSANLVNKLVQVFPRFPADTPGGEKLTLVNLHHLFSSELTMAVLCGLNRVKMFTDSFFHIPSPHHYSAFLSAAGPKGTEPFREALKELMTS